MTPPASLAAGAAGAHLRRAPTRPLRGCPPATGSAARRGSTPRRPRRAARRQHSPRPCQAPCRVASTAAASGLRAPAVRRREVPARAAGRATHPRPVRPADSALSRSASCGFTFLTSRVRRWLQSAHARSGVACGDSVQRAPHRVGPGFSGEDVAQARGAGQEHGSGAQCRWSPDSRCRQGQDQEDSIVRSVAPPAHMMLFPRSATKTSRARRQRCRGAQVALEPRGDAVCGRGQVEAAESQKLAAWRPRQLGLCRHMTASVNF
jgi:hypothetical protein